MQSKIVWTGPVLKLSPEQELQIAESKNFTDEARLAAFRRAMAKRWYENIVLVQKVTLDFRDIDPEDAAEVCALRSLIGTTPPWKQTS